MKFEIRTKSENGILKRNRNQILDALQYYDGKEIVLTIDRAKKQRSNGQNAYYWGMCLPLIQSGLKYATGEFRTADNIHYSQNCLQHRIYF